MKEPQIFTGIQKQDEPVPSNILDALKQNMEGIMEQWREYINEDEGSSVQYQGILKLKLDAAKIESLRGLIAVVESQGGTPLPDDKMHVTLIHQSVLKPYSKQLKGKTFPAPTTEVELDREIYMCEEDGKKSWVVYVSNPEVLRGYVNKFMEDIGGEPVPEPDREFHVSLANLTGKPGDSIAHAWGDTKCLKIQ